MDFTATFSRVFCCFSGGRSFDRTRGALRACAARLGAPMFSMLVLGRIACLTVGLSIVGAFFVGLALPAQAQEQPPSQDAAQQAQPQQQDQQQPQQEGQSQSQQSVEIDTNLFCDTQQQVQRFVSLLDENGGSAEAAIASVNDE